MAVREDFHKEFTIYETLAKMWLETEGVTHPKQYMYVLLKLGKKGLHHWESFPLLLLTTIRSSQTFSGKPLKAPSGRLQASEGKENRLFYQLSPAE